LAIGLVLGFLGLSRENALILAPAVLLWMGVRFSREPVSLRLRLVGFFIGGLLLVLVPVGLRNLTVGGEFKLTTSQFGPNFFIGNNSAADGTYDSVRKVIGEIQLEGPDAARLARRALGRDLTPGEVSDYWFEKSWAYIRAEPGDWLHLTAKKWVMVWNAREIEDSDDFYIYQQWSWLLSVLGSLNHFGILAPLAAMGLWLTRHRWRDLWWLYAMIFAFALSVTFFYVFGRYRFPLVPLLALFAGAGLVKSAALCRQRAWRSLMVATGLTAATAVVVNWPIYGISGPGPGGYNNLANAYYKQGKLEDATQTALKAIQLQGDYGVAHYNLGNMYAVQGRFDLAQEHFEEALRLYPNYAEVRSNLGRLMAEKGDVEGAIRHFRKAIELNPSLSAAQMNLGVALAKQGRLDEALGPLQAAARMAPDSLEAHFLLGNVYAAQNRYDEATKSFNEALRVNQDFAPAHERLAQLLSLQGRKEEAARHHQEALRLMRRKPAPSLR
jgi:Flp pilus assembly protein TadD